MGALTRAIQKRYTVLSGGSLENPANWMLRTFGSGNMSAAGVEVNEHNALYMIDVLTCVSKIASTFAQLPFPVYKNLPNGGRERAKRHPLYSVLNAQANPEMTAMVFKEALMGHLLTWGNAYAWIERDDGSVNAPDDVKALWPLLPDRTHPFRKDGGLWYYTRVKKSSTDEGPQKILPARDVLHIPGLGFDGLVGYPVIQYMTQAIGLGMAQDEYTGRMFSNGSVPPFVIKTAQRYKPDDMKRIQESWNERHRGVSNSFKTAILEEGMDIQTIGINPIDAQLLEAQKFSRTRIAGFYGVPAPLIGDTDRASAWGTGIEQLMIAWVKTGLQPWAVRWEQQVDMKLLLRQRDALYTAKVLMDGLQRGDQKSRYESYAIGFGKWLTADDIREYEDQNPYMQPAEGDIGKALLWPLNMAPAEDVASGEARKTTPPPPTTPPDAGPQDDPTSVASSRRAASEAQKIALADAADRIIRRESADLIRQSKKPREGWVDVFYEDHREYIRKQMGPLLRSYAVTIGSEVSRELGRPVEVPRQFVEKYIDGYAQRHVKAATAEVRDLDHKQIEAAVGSWTSRPEWIAGHEAVQAGNAFARAAYRQACVKGVEWVVGDDCKDCLALDRARVGRDAQFTVNTGQVVGHPPICEGCECVVVAASDLGRVT